jgi:hypothetical protein
MQNSNTDQIFDDKTFDGETNIIISNPNNENDEKTTLSELKTEKFCSDLTKDSIELSYFTNSKKCRFKLEHIDELSENLKLVRKSLSYLRKQNIYYITTILPFSAKFELEKNINFNFIIKKNNIIASTHLNHFEKLYLENLHYLLSDKTINFLPNANDDGWVPVQNNKNKLYKIKKEASLITSKWTEL